MFRIRKLLLIVFVFIILGCPQPSSNNPVEPETEKTETEKTEAEKPGTEKPGTEKPGTEKPGTEKPETENQNFNLKITKYGEIQIDSPSYVRTIVQVEDENGIPINSINQDNLIIYEDNEVVPLSQSALKISSDLDSLIEVILMIDNSVGIDISKAKNAAIELIKNADDKIEAKRDGLTGNYHFMIYSFSEEPILLNNDFTNDVDTLIDIINSITSGYLTTNLYGSIIEGSSKWEDLYNINKITQGYLILLTDGMDNASLYTIHDVIEQIGNKKIITLGINDKNTDVLLSLGNSGYYDIENDINFSTLIDSINKFSNSFYLIEYLSLKKGDFNRELSFQLINGEHTSIKEKVGLFNSKDFYSVKPGIYINDSFENSEGISDIVISKSSVFSLKLNTYYTLDNGPSLPPKYELSSDCNGTKIQIRSDETISNSFDVIPLGISDDKCVITIKDITNNFTKTLNCFIDPRFTITYDLNGATSGEVPTDSFFYESGEVVKIKNYISEPIMSNYVFKGWNTKSDGTGDDYSGGSNLSISTSNVVLYSKWEPVYRINYDLNGATSGEAPTDSFFYESGEVVKIKDYISEPIMSNYVFKGWNTKSDGTGDDYSAGSNLSISISNVVLYSKWEPVYRITYDLNGATSGEAPTDSFFYESGEVVKIKDYISEPIMSNYVFKGWNTKSDGTGDDYSGGSNLSISTSNVVLYSKWEPVYRINYDLNGATSGEAPTDSSLYEHGDIGTIKEYISYPQKNDSFFTSWNTKQDGSGKNYYPGQIIWIENDEVTLYANWIIHEGGYGPAGGYIFFDKGFYSNGWRYLEAAPTDISQKKTWGHGSYGEYDSQRSFVGSGYQNTIDLVGDSEHDFYAPDACSEYEIDFNGITYDDWFLPSIDSLSRMYDTLAKYSKGDYSLGFYWSSTDYTNSKAYFYNFTYGNSNCTEKSDELYVRPARLF